MINFRIIRAWVVLCGSVFGLLRIAAAVKVAHIPEEIYYNSVWIFDQYVLAILVGSIGAFFALITFSERHYAYKNYPYREAVINYGLAAILSFVLVSAFSRTLEQNRGNVATVLLSYFYILTIHTVGVPFFASYVIRPARGVAYWAVSRFWKN